MDIYLYSLLLFLSNFISNFTHLACALSLYCIHSSINPLSCDWISFKQWDRLLYPFVSSLSAGTHLLNFCLGNFVIFFFSLYSYSCSYSSINWCSYISDSQFCCLSSLSSRRSIIFRFQKYLGHDYKRKRGELRSTDL